MVEAGIEADDQRGIEGQSRVKTLYATDSRHPLSLPVEKNQSTDMRPGIIRWRLFSEEKSPNRVPSPEIRSNSNRKWTLGRFNRDAGGRFARFLNEQTGSK